MERAATVRSKSDARQIVMRPAPDCGCSAPAAGAASGASFAGIQFVGLFGLAERAPSARAAVDHGAVAHLDAEHFVALLQERIFGGDLAQAVGMRIDQLQIFAAAPGRLRLRLLHGIQHRIEQVQRDHHHHARQRIGALQLPGDACRQTARSPACAPADRRDRLRHTGSSGIECSA